MKTPDGEQLLTALAERHILLSGEDGRLRFRAPEGTLDETLKEALRDNKDTLVSTLRTHRGYVQIAPLSHNQFSLFFLHLLDPNTPAYNLALTLRLRAPANAAMLHEAVSRLVRQHPQLRTTLGYITLGERSVPAQFTFDGLDPAFIEHDAQSWSAGMLHQRAQDFYTTPIDLEQGPTVRAGLFRNAMDGDVFMLQLHHIAVDGWSLNVLASDLARHYQAAIQGLPGAGSPEAGSYVDFAVSQRRWLTGPEGMEQMKFWREALLPPPPPLELGDKSRRPAIRRAVGATRYFEINAADKARIEAAASQLGVTTFAWLLAAFQAFLMRRARLNDVCVGIPTFGRRGANTDNAVGYFANPVALRCRRPEALTFREHVQRTAQEMAAALDRRDLPLTALVENLGGARDPSRTPAFQVLFNLLTRRVLGNVVDLIYPGADETTVTLGGGLAAGAFALNQQEGQFDLTLEFVERGSIWLGLFKYCTDLFSAEEADSMLAEFRALLERALVSPDACLLEDIAHAAGGAMAVSDPRRQIAIAATFTAEPMLEMFEFWFERLGWQADVAFAPFNQVFQELINPSSLLRQNSQGTNLVFLRFDDLIELSDAAHPQSAAARLRANVDELAATIQAHVSALRAPLCIVLCPSSPRLSAMVPEEAALQADLIAKLLAIPGVNVLEPSTISNWHPVANWHEPAGEELGHIPYTPHYLAALATSSVRLINALTQKPVKALAIDCDGTLWDGVVGEDGPESVKVGPAQKEFQEFLLQQHRKGALLCLCSKNHEADVWAVFDRHPDMVLKREHIAFARINWLPKSANILSLVSEINFGPNAFVFLDDNALERAEVRAGCPDVLCPELPAAWEARMPFLKNLWPLDRPRATAEDQKRGEHYRSERLRAELRKEAGSYSDFLSNLQLVIETAKASTEDIDRLAQLTIRTNQFNTTVRRLTATDVASYVNQNGKAVFTTRVRDKFGDYGLVGAAFAEQQGDALVVDPLLLSCRALGRGVEHRMAAQLASHATATGCARVVFPVTPTDRNEPARSFLQMVERDCGGSRNEDGALRVAASELEALRFIPVVSAVQPEAGPEDVSAKTSESVSTWDSRVIQIATDFPTFEAVLTAHANWRQQRNRRPAPPAPQRTEAVTPLSETEQTITTAWKKTLALPEVGTGENFFEVGGSSLLAAQLALELRRQGLTVTLVDLFHYPTIALLARNLSAPPAPGSAAPEPAVSGAARLPAPFERLRRFRGK